MQKRKSGTIWGICRGLVLCPLCLHQRLLTFQALHFGLARSVGFRPWFCEHTSVSATLAKMGDCTETLVWSMENKVNDECKNVTSSTVRDEVVDVHVVTQRQVPKILVETSSSVHRQSN